VSAAVPDGFAPLRDRGGDFIAANGPVYVKREAEHALLGLCLRERHCTPDGRAHGGMLVALVQEAMGYAITEVHRRQATAASLTCDMLGPARLGDWVEARCETTRLALDVIFMRGEVSANGQLVLTASALWHLVRQD
jgi:uncharacterized protein (TIGR00369 family)